MKRINVLAADDDAVARGLLQQVLCEDLELDVTLAEDGAEAWQLLDQGIKPDLCVFDMMMPKMNGLELTKKLRADTRFVSLPIVLCTAVGEDSVIETAASLNVKAYIMKPYQTESLARALRQVLADL
jgi:two-component system, chemotaxis family, chemotaxis protein CheY